MKNIFIFCFLFFVSYGYSSSLKYYSDLTQSIINKETTKALYSINNGADIKKYENEESIKKIVTPKVQTQYIGKIEERAFPIVILAAASGEVEVIKAIKQKDIKALFLKDKDENDALMWASRQGNISTVKLLLEYGFDPLYKSKLSNTTAFDLALNKNKMKIVKLFVKKLIEEKRTEKLSELIWFLSGQNSNDLIKELLEYGIKDRYKAISPRISLMKVARSGDIDMFKLLVKYGSDPYESNIQGKRKNYDALSYAILSSDNKMTKYLLKNYIYDLSKKLSGDNYLHFAYTKYSNIDTNILKLLITKSKIDPNSLDKYNRTLLAKAIIYNNIEKVEFFLKYSTIKNKIFTLSKGKVKSYEQQYRKVNNKYNLNNLNISKKILQVLKGNR